MGAAFIRGFAHSNRIPNKKRLPPLPFRDILAGQFRPPFFRSGRRAERM